MSLQHTPKSGTEYVLLERPQPVEKQRGLLGYAQHHRNRGMSTCGTGTAAWPPVRYQMRSWAPTLLTSAKFRNCGTEISHVLHNVTSATSSHCMPSCGFPSPPQNVTSSSRAMMRMQLCILHPVFGCSIGQHGSGIPTPNAICALRQARMNAFQRDHFDTTDEPL